MNTQPMWAVELTGETFSAVLFVFAPDTYSAGLRARFEAWSATGKWLALGKIERREPCTD